MPKSLSHRAERDSSPTSERVVALHLEPFPIWVGRNQNPSWKGRLVAALAHDRITAVDSLARKAGISVGMRSTAAVSKLPNLHLYPVDTPALQAAWETVLEDLQIFSPWLEPLHPGRVLLRMGAVEARILAEVYGARVGVSRYREIAELAALAAFEGQARVVEDCLEQSQTDRMPLYLLKGVGLTGRSLEWLNNLGQHTVGELRGWSQEQLRRTLPEFKALKPYLLGPWGQKVNRFKPPEHIKVTHSFAVEALEPFEFEPILQQLAERLSAELRDRDKAASRLRITVLACGNQYTATRLSKEPLKQAKKLYRVARLALEDTLALGLPLQRLSLEISALSRPALQEGLWESRGLRERAVEMVAERFPEVWVKEQILDPYALSADQRSRMVRVLDGA